MADVVANLGMGGSVNPYLGQSNPYLQQIIDMSSKDLTDNYNRTTLPAFNAAMVKSGSFGNSGVDEMTRAGADQLQKNLGDLSSKLRFNDYGQQQDMYRWDQDFGRQVYNDSYAQNMGNMQMGMSLLDMLAGTNARDYATATGVQDTPLNYLTQFSNLAGALGRGGQTSTTTSAGGGGSAVTGALGGAQLGSAFGKWLGNGSTYSGINASGAANGYGNTFQQNGYSPDVSYG